MRFISHLKIVCSTLLCLFMFSWVSGQNYSFKTYGAEDIPNSFVYTVNQSDNGYLWVGTGGGLSHFDGFSFVSVAYPDSALRRYTTTSAKDKNGNLWFGCDDGTVFYTEGDTLVGIKTSNRQIISEIIAGDDGLIYIIPQGRTILVADPENPDSLKTYPFSLSPVMFSAGMSQNGDLLIGTQDNVVICKIDSDTLIVKDVIEGFDYAGVTSIQRTNDNNVFLIGTNGMGLYLLRYSENESSLTHLSGDPELDYLEVQSIFYDSDGDFWISTFGSGVIQMHFTENFNSIESKRHYDMDAGLPINDVKIVFQDIEGNYWIGLYGEGLSKLSSFAFSYYTPGTNVRQNNILYISQLGKNYILGTPAGFHLFNPESGRSDSFINLTGISGIGEIASYFLDDEKNLWIGTRGNGLFVRSPAGIVSRFYITGDSGLDDIKDIKVDNQNIWLATTNGVILLDRISREQKERFDINNRLPHNSISKILISNDGMVYIGTESEFLYSIDKDFNVQKHPGSMLGSTRNKMLSFTQSMDGGIWTSTKGNGVFEFIDDTIISISRSEDLMSNYCYSILADSENNIWVGHERGFSRYNLETGIMRVFGTDFVKVGVCNPDGMYESADHKVFIGTTEGLVVYDRQEDRKKAVAPFNNINYVIINNIKYPYQKSYSLPYSKNYTVRVNFTGINLSDPEKVFYSTFMENYDKEWSNFSTERELPYGLSSGKYKFNLISINEDGLSQENPVSFDIIIKPPFWRRWWFIISAVLTLTTAVVLIIRKREKAQNEIKEYLERELEARTRVVMKQKGEIELQNIEITDSINYAKRIQTSILPDINKLKETFRDAFIFFHPRDIVSGDFYWFDKLDDNKFIVVCADSTGHGVPGAFMSMIGSTLLQDIVTRKRISRPSEILKLLDEQIFSTLNQNVELGVSNDGMDMVVCEFNVKTRHVRFASAMRPVIIVIDGESYYIKGNRLSIGGESVIEKYFDDQEYYLNEGDTVYLFSDGLPDQFGGEDGKKLKIARLKRLIEDIAKMPMNEQLEVVSKYYFDWKGDQEQVDDILFMGVRV